MAEQNMRIDKFQSAIRDGGARPNLFQVTGNFPTESVGDMVFLIRAASLPQASVGTIEVPYRGRKLKLAGDRTFDQWTVTVVNTNSFELRRAFEAWQEVINGHASNKSAINTDQYFANWQVEQLDRSGVVSQTYVLNGCYPQNVGPIELSHETNDEIETFEVTFDYQYWVHNGVNAK